MRKFMIWGMLVATSLWCSAGRAWSDDILGLKEGNPELKSAGPLAFGPQGTLFIGDVKGAAIVAVATNDGPSGDAKEPLSVNDLGGALAKALKVPAAEVRVQDLAVNPKTGNVYLSLALGADGSQPAVVRVDRQGGIQALDLTKIAFSKAELADAPEDREVGEGRRRQNNRLESITDLAFVDGNVIVSGLSSAQSPSRVRSIVFPFKGSQAGSSLEIYHGAHGRLEDYAPIRVFVPFNIDGQPNLLAGFTCTPLVRFPLGEVTSSESSSGKLRGTTVAELGNRNRPLDMIVYKKDGKDFLLLANSSRGVMKVSTEDIERPAGIDQPVSGGGTAGQTYDTIESLKGVVQLDKVDDQHGIVIVQGEDGGLTLSTIELP